jgi:hypothetical protein
MTDNRGIFTRATLLTSPEAKARTHEVETKNKYCYTISSRKSMGFVEATDKNMALVMIKRGIPRKLHNEIEIKIHKDIG